MALAVQAVNSCKTKTDTRDLCRRWPDYTSHYMLRWCCHMYFGRHPDNYFGLDKFAYLTPSSIYRYPRSSQECGLANCAASNGLMSISKPGDPYAPTGRRLGKDWPHKNSSKNNARGRASSSRFSQPYLVIVERGAAIGCNRIGPGKRIDATAVGIG